MHKAFAYAALVLSLATARDAVAEQDPPAPQEKARAGGEPEKARAGGEPRAEPETPRLITIPTAWLPRSGVVVGSAGLDLTAITRDKRFDGDLLFAFGIGQIAALDVGVDKDVRGCVDCAGDRPAPMWLARVAFRMGARQDMLFRGSPALVVGVRTTVAAHGAYDRIRNTTAYVVASRVLGPIKLHAGVTVDDASFGDDYAMGRVIHPVAGFEWTPSQYPRTTLIGDFTYVPRFEGDSARMEWIAGWGVRYQALSWGTIDLAVRHRQDEGPSDSTVLVRVTGVFNAPSSAKPVR